MELNQVYCIHYAYREWFCVGKTGGGCRSRLERYEHLTTSSRIHEDYDGNGLLGAVFMAAKYFRRCEAAIAYTIHQIKKTFFIQNVNIDERENKSVSRCI